MLKDLTRFWENIEHVTIIELPIIRGESFLLMNSGIYMQYTLYFFRFNGTLMALTFTIPIYFIKLLVVAFHLAKPRLLFLTTV